MFASIIRLIETLILYTALAIGAYVGLHYGVPAVIDALEYRLVDAVNVK